MKIKTLNSEYIVKDNELWKNGVLYTDNIRFIGGMDTVYSIPYKGTPKVGDMLLIEYHDGATMRSIRTSMITEVEQ